MIHKQRMRTYQRALERDVGLAVARDNLLDKPVHLSHVAVVETLAEGHRCLPTRWIDDLDRSLLACDVEAVIVRGSDAGMDEICVKAALEGHLSACVLKRALYAK